MQELRRAELPDLVVAVTHTGLTLSRQLAREIPELDVILSGHTHERTHKAIREGKVLVVEAGSNGSFLGRLDLTLNPDGGVADHAFQLIPIHASDFAEEAGLAGIVKRVLELTLHQAMEKYLLSQKTIAPQRERRSRATDLPESAFSQDQLLSSFDR